MALYPTQYNTWKELQKIKGHENDCGRPGINGGYMINQNYIRKSTVKPFKSQSQIFL
jgi:hypothetical protein